MPPKRRNDNDDSGSDEPDKKKPAPKLKKSKLFKWTDVFSAEKPEGEYALKCIERWCLLAPYNHEITEEQWKKYYVERNALDVMNSSGSEESKPIVSEELGQDTFKILRLASARVAAAVHGSVLPDTKRRTEIARTLMGSLYYLSLWGNDEEGGGDNPRTVKSKTRLYSPFGLGTSIDFAYDYHYRMFRANEKFATFVAKTRVIDKCSTGKPAECAAVAKDKQGREKPVEDSVKLFNMSGSKITGTTAVKYDDFEETLFGSTKWLSPLKLYNMMCAAGTVMLYHEGAISQTVGKAGTDKFKFFQLETDGMAKAKQELQALSKLEKEEDEKEEENEKADDDEDVVCIPQRLLLLARQSEE